MNAQISHEQLRQEAVDRPKGLLSANGFLQRHDYLFDTPVPKLIALDANCHSTQVPFSARVNEAENYKFWAECASAALVLSVQAVDAGNITVARHYRRMFRVAKSNRRRAAHLRIVNPENYAPLVRCVELLKMLYATGKVYAHKQSTFAPLIEPFSAWARAVHGKDLSQNTPESEAMSLIAEIQSSILVALECGIAGRSPTDAARLIMGGINDAISRDLNESQTHASIYGKLCELKRFLSPYLLDVSYFKKKHRLDSFLN